MNTLCSSKPPDEWAHCTAVISLLISWYFEPSQQQRIIIIIIIIINPLTARIIGAPQMILQPVCSIFPCSPLPSVQACPFPDVVFPPLPLSALSSSPFHSALQDGFHQIWWAGDKSIPLQSASLYDGKVVFVWSNYCLLDVGTDFLVGKMVFVWDA